MQSSGQHLRKYDPKIALKPRVAEILQKWSRARKSNERLRGTWLFRTTENPVKHLESLLGVQLVPADVAPPPFLSLSLSKRSLRVAGTEKRQNARLTEKERHRVEGKRNAEEKSLLWTKKERERERERDTRAHTHTRKASNEAQAPLERERKAANGYRRRACLCLCFGKWLMTSRPDLLFCHPTRERNERSARRGRRWTDTGERWAVAVISAALDDGQPWKMTIATKKYFTGGAFERRRYAPWAPHVHT